MSREDWAPTPNSGEIQSGRETASEREAWRKRSRMRRREEEEEEEEEEDKQNLKKNM